MTVSLYSMLLGLESSTYFVVHKCPIEADLGGSFSAISIHKAASTPQGCVYSTRLRLLHKARSTNLESSQRSKFCAELIWDKICNADKLTVRSYTISG
jgi:hypothetical protein